MPKSKNNSILLNISNGAYVAILSSWNSGTIMTWGSFVSKSLSLLIILPLILTKFQTSEISLWYLFSTIIGLQIFFDIGFSPTFSRVLAYAMGGAAYHELRDYRVPICSNNVKRTPNIDTLERIFSTMHFVYFWLTILVMILMIVIGTWSLLRPISKVPDIKIAWLSWVIILATSYVIFRGNTYSTYLQGTDNIALLRRWEMVFSMFSIFTSFIILLVGGGLLGLVISCQFWRAFNVLFNYMLCRNLNILHLKLIQKKVVDQDILKSVWPSAWRSGIGMLMSRVLLDGSGIVYAQFGQSGQVATYLLALRLIQMVSQFSTAPFYSQLPLLAKLRAIGDTDRQVKIAIRGMAFSYWTYVAGFVLFGLCGPLMFSLIGSNANFPDKLLWALFGIGMLAERYGAMHIQLYSTTNHIIWHKVTIVSGIILILTSSFLLDLVGRYAFPIAIIIAYIGYYSWYSASHSYKAFNLQFIKFEASTLMLPLIIMLLFILMEYIIL